jgi:hypothetical protein
MKSSRPMVTTPERSQRQQVLLVSGYDKFRTGCQSAFEDLVIRRINFDYAY